MHRNRKVISALITLTVLSSLLGVIGLSGVYLYLNPRLPSVEALRDVELQVPLRIYSSDGLLIGEFGEKFRTPLHRDRIPQQLINAILAAEDDRFLKHKGVDLAGLVRAALELLRSGEIRTGGSTITMQVARNFFLSSERSFARKFNEILLSLKIERALSKDEILELYVNKIYLGKRAYGIQAASSVYYGKDIGELELAQLAMIAGLPKAPSAYNPINNPERALQRRNWILGRMLKLGFIDEADYNTAIDSPVTASNHGPRLQLNAGYAAEMARAFVLEKFGSRAYTDGLRVVTTIDSNYQHGADTAVVRGLDAYTRRHGYRGPEKDLSKLGLEDQLTALDKESPIRDLYPALVLNIGSDEQVAPTDQKPARPEQPTGLIAVKLALPGGRLETLYWNPESDGLRRYISEDSRSATVHNIEELISVGNLVRIRFDDNGNAKLAQAPSASAGLVSLDPYDGAIRAIVGGYDFASSKFNRALQAYRQPGSNFKPFIYAAAFANGYTASSVINDAPIVFNDANLETDWRPENASGKFYGPTTLRRALYLSRNLVSVRLLREMGIQSALDYLQKFDFSAGPLPRDLSLALGSYTMTPLEVASLYAVIANGGFKVKPYIVDSIYNRDDGLLYRANPALACDDCEEGLAPGADPANTATSELVEAESLQDLLGDNSNTETAGSETADESIVEAPAIYAERVMDARIAYILDNILQDVIQRGTATRARELGRRDLAGKTGTTNGPTDAWFSGYHPQLVTTSWLGFDNNEKLGRREFGGSAALPIWMDYMRDILPGLPVAKRVQPEGLLALKIDRLTGSAPSLKTQETLFEIYREEFAPDFSLSLPGRSEGPMETVLEEGLF